MKSLTLKLITAIFKWAIISIILPISLNLKGQSNFDIKLFEACKIGDIIKAEKMILKGANVNYYSTFHETPLVIAVDRNYNELAKLLISKGANPSLKIDCFFIEYQYQRKDGKYEVRIGKNQEGENAFIFAIQNGNEEIFDTIINKDFDADFEYQPSVQIGNYDVSELYSVSKIAAGGLSSDLSHKQGNIEMNINGIQITKSENPSYTNELVCIVYSKPIDPITYTPLKEAILCKKKNYHIIEKLAELSSHELNNDVEKLKEIINDSKTIEILKKYKFIQ